ncbi:MAG: hypothetical protein A2Y17_00670 [Clostridiales bacterium GWF2_38_85]|nr:MAG: hypothetical protein A2Y17_00670 [Clostridiales bacterium GWF2_38_85]
MLSSDFMIISPSTEWDIEFFRPNKEYSPFDIAYNVVAHNEYINNYISSNNSKIYINEKLMLSSYKGGSDTWQRCFKAVECNCDEVANIIIYTYEAIRLWVNGVLVYNYRLLYPCNLKIQLNKGINIFCLEFYSGKSEQAFEIHICAETENFNNSSLSLFVKNNYLIDNHNCILTDKNLTYSYIDEDEYMFILSCCDTSLVTVSKEYTLDIYAKYNPDNGIYNDYDTTKSLYTYQGKFGHIEKVDLNSLRNSLPNDVYAVQLSFRYTHNKKTVYFKRDITIKNFQNYLNQISKIVGEMIENESLSVFDKWYFEYYFDKIPLSFWYADMCSILIKLKNQGMNIELEYKENIIQNKKRLVFKSKLDRQYEYIEYVLPVNYNSSSKYPLLIICSAYYHDFHSHEFYDQNEYIVADISGRGILTGSYIDEVQFFESLEYILSMCSVNLDKIFLTGFSNGAYTAWTLAQNYPDRFAGILLGSGTPDIDKLKNLCNMKVITLSSKEDKLYKHTYEIPIQTLNQYGNINGYIISSLSHSQLYLCIFNKVIINDLFSFSNKKNKDQVLFLTRDINHNKIDDLIIEEIDKRNNYAAVQIKRTHKQVNINTIGVKQISYYNAFDDKLIINKKEIKTESKLNFYKILDDIEVNKSSFIKNNFTGLGWAQVYLGPLVVCCNEKSIVNSLANSFAKPYSMGYDTNLNVKYPILKNISNNNTNIIYIDFRGDNYEYEKVKDIFPIKCLADSFIYMNHVYNCDYSIIQIIKYHHDNYYVSVTSNNESHFKKNIVFRKVILSSYTNGFNPYLNCESLIFMNDKYYMIKYYGDELIEI